LQHGRLRPARGYVNQLGSLSGAPDNPTKFRMKTFDARKPGFDFDVALAFLNDEGFVVIEGLLDTAEVANLRNSVQSILDTQRQSPFDPGEGQPFPGEDALRQSLRQYFATSY